MTDSKGKKSNVTNFPGRRSKGSASFLSNRASLIIAGQRVSFDFDDMDEIFDKGRDSIIHYAYQGISVEDVVIDSLVTLFSSEGSEKNLQNLFTFIMGAIALYDKPSDKTIEESHKEKIVSIIEGGGEPVILPNPANGLPFVFRDDDEFTISVEGFDFLLSSVDFSVLSRCVFGELTDDEVDRSRSFIGDLSTESSKGKISDMSSFSVASHIFKSLRSVSPDNFHYIISGLVCVQKIRIEFDVSNFEKQDDSGEFSVSDLDDSEIDDFIDANSEADYLHSDTGDYDLSSKDKKGNVTPISKASKRLQ